MVISVTFCVMVIVFVVYDVLVQRRNAKLIQNAAQSNAIVSSMFPSQIRDRLIGSSAGQTGAKSLKSYMKAPNAAKLESSAVDDSKPLADLFLATFELATIYFVLLYHLEKRPAALYGLAVSVAALV